MGDLSKNFSRWEFRCPCCGLDAVDPVLVESLQLLRDIVGPLHINSACRCPKHNAEVGGKANSQHLYGKAADIRADRATPEEVAMAAEKIPSFNYGGIGRYNTFTHVDVRGRKARWNNRSK